MGQAVPRAVKYVSVYLSIVLTAMLSTASSAALYMYQAPDGSWMFSDYAVRGGEYKLVRKADSRRGIVAAARGGNAAYRGDPSAYDRLIRQMGRVYGVDAALIKAVMHVESAFNPYATSRKGALGLMQLMPTTAQRYGAREAYDPVQNVRAAVKYLKDLIERYNNKTRLVLAAYNAGETAVEQYDGVPPYQETRRYISKVLKYKRRYAAEF